MRFTPENVSLASLLARIRLIVSARRQARIKHTATGRSAIVDYLTDLPHRPGSPPGTKVLIDFGLSIQQTDGADAARLLLSNFPIKKHKRAIVAICAGSGALSRNGFITRYDRYSLSPHPQVLLNFSPLLKESIEACAEQHLGLTFPVTKPQLDAQLKLSNRKAGPKVTDYISLKNYLHHVQINLWNIFYSDLFLYINYLLDPESRLTKKRIAYALNISRYCGFDMIVCRLIILRALAGDKSSIYFVKQQIDWIIETASIDKLAPYVRAALLGRPVNMDNLDIVEEPYPVENLMILQLYLSSSSDAEEFMYRLADCYEIDESIIYFIDWKNRREWISQSSNYIVPHLLFLSSVLTDDKLMRIHPFLSRSYWYGAATSDIERLAYELPARRTPFTRSNRSNFHTFLVRLATLPKRANYRTFSYLLRPTIIERLSSILSVPTPKRDYRSDQSKHASIALYSQMEVLRFAGARRIIPGDFVEQRSAELRAHLRTTIYADFKSLGMIRISEADIEKELKQFFSLSGSEYLPLLGSIKQNGKSGATVFENYIATQIVDRVCFKSRYAFDYILSNWLRHGWLFRSLENLVISIAEEYDIDETQVRIVLTALEGDVERFNSSDLTITESTEIYGSLKDLVIAWLGRLPLASPIPDSLHLAILARNAISSLQLMLNAARDRWVAVVAPSFLKRIEGMIGEDTKRTDSVRHHQSVAKFQAYVQETAGWMGINAQSEPAGDFRDFRELVTFEIENILMGVSAKKQINFEIYNGRTGARMHSYNIQVPTKYLKPLISFIDNTTANGLKKSGHRNLTPFNYIVHVYNEEMVIDARNRFRATDSNQMRKDLAELQRSITDAKNMTFADLSSKSRKQGGSGVSKIVFEFNQAFGDGWLLDAESSAIDMGWFSVRAALPIVGARLVPPVR